MATDLLKITPWDTTPMIVLVPQQELDDFIKKHAFFNNPVAIAVTEKVPQK